MCKKCSRVHRKINYCFASRLKSQFCTLQAVNISRLQAAGDVDLRGWMTILILLPWCHPHHIRCTAEPEHNCVITNVYRCRLLAAGESGAAWEVAQSTARWTN